MRRLWLLPILAVAFGVLAAACSSGGSEDAARRPAPRRVASPAPHDARVEPAAPGAARELVPAPDPATSTTTVTVPVGVPKPTTPTGPAPPSPATRPASPGAAPVLAPARPVGPGVVTARMETDPAEGDADDPAIWIDRQDPARSLVIGTDKQHGLAVYDLSGRELQFIEEGTPNNVDLRDGFALAGQPVSLVVATDAGDETLRVYRVDAAARRLVDVAARGLKTGIDAHGLCLYRNPEGALYAFANAQEGDVEQWELFDDGKGRVDTRLVREWDAGRGVEGCVVDDAHQRLFVAQEAAGVWSYGAEPSAPTTEPVLVDRTGRDGHLVADVEGLAIVDTGAGDGYLVVSNQGDDSFSVYRRRLDHAFVGRFSVTGEGQVDGCENTDGIEVASSPLGPSFPRGLFVCHDGKNGDGATNFKLVPLEAILHWASPS